MNITEEEIEEAIKYWELEDDYYNFKTPKGTYALYCMICFIEHRKLKVVRIRKNKCETKVISPGAGLSIHWYHVRDNYNENLEYKNNKIMDFEII